jgi:hypothetical protein
MMYHGVCSVIRSLHSFTLFGMVCTWLLVLNSYFVLTVCVCTACLLRAERIGKEHASCLTIQLMRIHNQPLLLCYASQIV